MSKVGQREDWLSQKADGVDKMPQLHIDVYERYLSIVIIKHKKI